jgi:tetratricopeptide (TPR) repeat protein
MKSPAGSSRFTLADPSRFDWQQVDIRARPYERAIIDRFFSNELSLECRVQQRELEEQFLEAWKRPRPEIDKLLAADPTKRPTSFGQTAETARVHGGVLWLFGQKLYDRVTGKLPTEDEIKAFMDVCPPFRAACYTLCGAWYDGSLTIPIVKRPVGRNDHMMAVYLPYCGRFVTRDKKQKARLQEIAVHTDTLLSEYNIGDILYQEGNLPGAEKFIRGVFDAQNRVLEAENADALASKAELARILIREGRYQEAEEMAQQAFDAQLRVLGPQHPDTLTSLQFLSTAMVYNHRYEDANQRFEEVIEKLTQSQSENVSIAWYNFACVAAAAHDRDQAVQHLREAVKHGYKDVDHIRNDDDLKSLRGYARFEAFLSEAKKNTEAASRQLNSQ